MKIGRFVVDGHIHCGKKDVTAKDTNNTYRITLKNASGVETWIYVPEDNLYRFPKDETITVTKELVKRYSEQK